MLNHQRQENRKIVYMFIPTMPKKLFGYFQLVSSHSCFNSLYVSLVTGWFDVSSRGDTQEFSDLNKLAKRFLKGGRDRVEGEAKDVPSRAYIQEVVEELRKGEEGECPICLEAFEDAVLTPCAHRLCRECLLASWRTATSGLCPVCRYFQVAFV